MSIKDYHTLGVLRALEIKCKTIYWKWHYEASFLAAVDETSLPRKPLLSPPTIASETAQMIELAMNVIACVRRRNARITQTARNDAVALILFMLFIFPSLADRRRLLSGGFRGDTLQRLQGNDRAAGQRLIVHFDRSECNNIFYVGFLPYFEPYPSSFDVSLCVFQFLDHRWREGAGFNFMNCFVPKDERDSEIFLARSNKKEVSFLSEQFKRPPRACAIKLPFLGQRTILAGQGAFYFFPILIRPTKRARKHCIGWRN